MFKQNNNHILHKLRNTQAKIKKCKDVMAQYNCPEADWHTAQGIMEYFKQLMIGTISVDAIVKYHDIDLNYLEEFGTYLANFAKYQKDTQKYQLELDELKKEERKLKDALGIE